jgi:ubiquinone/menaquinone biosynthesis C-methylase UbiE
MLVGMLDLEPSMVVLDVATGAGHTALAIAPRVEGVIAVDLASEMIEQVQALAAARGIDNIRALVMDVDVLGFGDESFDVVTCRIAPHHFLDVERALQEIARVLCPGGQFGLEDSYAPADAGLDRFINEVERLRDPTHVRSYTEAEWRDMLRAAGFEIVRLEYHRKTHDVAEWIERSAIDQAAADRVYAAFAAASPQAREHFRIEYDEDGRALSFTDDKLILRADKRV